MAYSLAKYHQMGWSTRETTRWTWLTTQPNPRSFRGGYDAGQRGWRVHAVRLDNQTGPAMCGLQPAHGWGADLFIDRECARCVAAFESLSDADMGEPRPFTLGCTE